MEARKEKQQQQQQQQMNEDEMGKAREVIREAIIHQHPPTPTSNSSAHTNTHTTAQKAEDVLAYSRAVNHTDSSLQ